MPTANSTNSTGSRLSAQRSATEPPLSRAHCRCFALFVAIVLAGGTAYPDGAREVAGTQDDRLGTHGARPIAAIRIEGLRRTRPRVVSQWITCTVGAPLRTCDLTEIRERIYRLGIFSSVDIALNDGLDGEEIVFTIDEKWTLYPVPMLWFSPGSEIAGLILVEANLLGYNKGVAIGGVTSNRGWYTVAGYNDPNVAFTNLWSSVHVFFGSGLIEDNAPDGSTQQSFDMKRFDVEYTLGWTFWDRVSPAWTGGMRWARIGTVHVPGTEPATDATVALQGFEVIYSDRRFRDPYDEGLRVSAEVQHGFSLDRVTTSYNDAIFDAKYARPGLLRGFWEVHGRVFVGALPVPLEERLGGLDGSRTIPGSGLVGVDKYASLSLSREVPLVTMALGTLNGVGFGEVGRYLRNAEPVVTYGGPGVGFRFFLKHVAIPAVGLDVGYEIGSRRVAFSVAIGYRPLR